VKFFILLLLLYPFQDFIRWISSRYLASVTDLGTAGECLTLCRKQDVYQNFMWKGLIVLRSLMEGAHLLLEVGEVVLGIASIRLEDGSGLLIFALQYA
jgi:hypothetical protein